MASLQFMIGTWDCSFAEMVAPGGPNQEFATFIYTFVAPNSLGIALSTPGFSESGSIQYDAQRHSYHLNMTNGVGGTLTETADKVMPAHTVFTGTVVQAGKTVQMRDTEDKISDTQFHAVTEVNMGGNWSKIGESSCTRR